MDPESASTSPESRSPKTYRTNLLLAYQSFGVVFGDLTISPIYVYKSTFSGKLRLHEEDDEVLGILSLVFWTLTLIALCKYTAIVLGADDNGEGGTFALYSLLCRNSKMGLLHAQHAVPEHLAAYNPGTSGKETKTTLIIKNFFEKHQSSRILLLLFVLMGTSMVVGDGVLTPAMSVLSAVSGLEIKFLELHENYSVFIACLIIVALFALQHYGTHRVGFLFAPILIAWLACIGGLGIYNTIKWNPSVVRAISPYYIYNFFKKAGKDGWSSLGGAVLCITGAEAMFADLGHFSKISIRMAFTWIVYPCLLLAYMGEAAYLSKHKEDLERSFFKAIPGLSVITVMLVTTCLMFLIITTVWNQSVFSAFLFTIIFASLELLYFTACLLKFPHGGWLPFLLSIITLTTMSIWHYGTAKKLNFELHNKVSLDSLLSLGPTLGLARVPGVALVLTNSVAGVPPMFAHFVTNFPAFHRVLIFVSVQTYVVPTIPENERFLIGRYGSKEHKMFWCILRYGYKDGGRDNYDFENRLLAKVTEFLRFERVGNVGGMRRVRFVCEDEECKEVKELMEEREAGVAYMMGNTIVVAREDAPLVKKLAIDGVYGFLRRNSRRPAVALGVPHTSLIEVGMVYNV
ncbi:uncharacterized protein A4U43_C06F840 [Asparagus officinalis]|uniref:Potassium transporter n=1 Tax=Asparagus officinalis TaxID=4686 RepID=A0A5P1EJ26_ASPOF|nr:uncharacterized protein A4U43_C06F840 [Asparagus officinalis]